MRIHHTKQIIHGLPDKRVNLLIDLDSIVAAREYEDNNTQVVTCFGLEYIIVDKYEDFYITWASIKVNYES